MSRVKLLAVIFCVLLAGCGGLNDPLSNAEMSSATSKPEDAAPFLPTQTAVLAATPELTVPTPSPTPEPTPTPGPVEVNIMAVGDLMFQYHAIKTAYDKETKTYDFKNSFEYVKDIISSADIAAGNFESTFGGPEYAQRQELRFSVPDEAADALKYAGFDVLSTVNNHAYDKGSAGVLRTLQVLKERGLTTVGTRGSQEEKPYAIVEAKGIKIGFTAYTFGGRTSKGGVTIHGYRVGNDVIDLMNVYADKTVDEDIAQMGEIIRRMREDGAEIVAFYIHWGTEYKRSPNAIQKKIAQRLADAGADVIFGSHPHWMQPLDVLTGKNGNKTVVMYSLGNFISNQRDEFEPYFTYSEDCMILNVKVTKQPGGAAEITSVEYLPTWTYMFTVKGLRHYTVVPLEKAIASPADFGMNTGRDVRDAKKSLNHTLELMAKAEEKGYVTMMKLD